VPANSNFVASFFVNVSPNVQAGAYPVSMILSDDKGQSVSDFTFDISPKANFLVTGVDDSQLYPGATNVPLKLTVKNSGNITAETVTAKLLGANSITGVKSSTITSVGDVVLSGNVLPGQSVPMTFIVNLDPTFVAGEQTTSVEIDWTQSSNSTSFVETVTVPYHLNSGPNYLLYYQGFPLTYFIVAAVIVAILIAYIIGRKRQSERVSLAMENQEPQQAIDDETFGSPRLPDVSNVLKSPDDSEDLR
jgi:hypothetical protein